MNEQKPMKRGLVSVVLVVLAAALIISPAYVGGYLQSHGRLGIGSTALLSLAMFLVGAFLLIRILKE
jgi:uncharacterized membrane protein